MLLSLSRLRAAVKSGPPFVLFTIAIFALGLSTLSIGLLISGSSDPLSNPDVISWDSLLKGLSGLKYCITPANSSISTPLSGSGLSLSFPMSSISVEGNKKNLFPSRLSGSIHVKELTSLKNNVKADYHSSNIPVTFILSKKGELSCISIHGPDKLLKDLKRIPLSSQDSRCDNKTFSQDFTFHTLHSLSCPQETTLRLSYTSKTKWALFLSLEDRANIYSHLMWTTLVLFMVVAVIMGIACIRGVGSRDNYRYSSRRGDMELLRSDSPLE